MDRLEHWLYGTLPPSLHRHQPMKVLALGMGRSGTDSLSKALSTLGYNRVYHGFDMGMTDPPSWEAWVKLARRKWKGNSSSKGSQGDSDITISDLDCILGDCTAATGSPVAIMALEMVQAYPNAKVILNMRDSGKWVQSAKSTFGVVNAGFKYRVLPYFDAQLYWRKRYYEEMVQAYFYGSLENNGKWVYEQHCAKIRGLVPQSQLLEWRAEDGWEPLCRFVYFSLRLYPVWCSTNRLADSWKRIFQTRTFLVEINQSK
ncbi:hypothetical protein P170DRAFT_402845 [Aspergillus steynii IBT 23096]|uniref:P-loop containing nucleoside triphosphate hydrolase protein n=1 Tax=Aspergillus steynii IBT 23096 TaxID=1392250 RepID=A0A2I2GI55_9EURO|nr:uncharacterized protein P170DRAFT_402845 [Aspergillus steynii IBT 23096]PLB52563.1 hypothetical protein P170DRAFT_402845 [Aspergillus steynii IBT 23096]